MRNGSWSSDDDGFGTESERVGSRSSDMQSIPCELRAWSNAAGVVMWCVMASWAATMPPPNHGSNCRSDVCTMLICHVESEGAHKSEMDADMAIRER